MDKKIKFLLINPTATPWRVGQGRRPSRKTQIFRYSMLTSLYVASAMPSTVDTRVLDEDVEPVDYDSDADLVGISFMTFNAPHAYEIADTFRKVKGKTVIVGGYHPSFLPEEAKAHADAVCVGEAENIVTEMILDFSRGRLKPFYRNGPVALAGLAVPDRRLLARSFYAPVDAVQASRGCPNRCRFCSITSFFRHSFRKRPVEEVIDELRGLRQNILFMDDNITTDPEYAKELFSAMIPLRKRWFSQCSVRIVYDDELLGLAARSGCRGLFVGLESLSQENLQDWGKGFNRVKDYTLAVAKLHRHGIGIAAGIVFGHDRDTPEIFPRTLEFLDSAKVDALQATLLTPFPGTPLFEDLEREGRIFDRDWSHYDFGHVVFEPKGMSRQALREGHAGVVNAFHSKPRAARRLWNALRFLDAETIFRLALPLNLGYPLRHRLARVFRNSEASAPAQAEARREAA